MKPMKIMKVMMVASLLAITTVQAEVQQTPSEVALANAPVLKGLLELKLTKDQKGEIAKILKDYRPEIQDGLDAVLEAREDLFEAIHAPTFNESAVRDAARHLAAEQEEFAVLRSTVVHELRGQLTVEQQEKMAQVRHDLVERIRTGVELIRAVVNGWVESNG